MTHMFPEKGGKQHTLGVLAPSPRGLKARFYNIYGKVSIWPNSASTINIGAISVFSFCRARGPVFTIENHLPYPLFLRLIAG